MGIFFFLGYKVFMQFIVGNELSKKTLQFLRSLSISYSENCSKSGGNLWEFEKRFFYGTVKELVMQNWVKFESRKNVHNIA